MNAALRRTCAAILVTASWCRCVPADDDRIEGPDAAVGIEVDVQEVVILGEFADQHRAGSHDLLRRFDAAVFGVVGAIRQDRNLNGGAVVINNNVNNVLVIGGPAQFVSTTVTAAGAVPTGEPGALARLAGLRREGVGRIELLTRSCGLREGQRAALGLALESDLRRAAGQIDAVRDRYLGGAAENLPGRESLAQDVMACRGVIAATFGPGSLLALMVEDVLSPEQAEQRRHWRQERRECRWRATVAAALVALDETIGLSSRQHEALESFLVDTPPPLPVDGIAGPRPPLPVVLAFRRLASEDADRLSAVFDPRQWRALRTFVEPHRDIDVEPLLDKNRPADTAQTAAEEVAWEE